MPSLTEFIAYIQVEGAKQDLSGIGKEVARLSPQDYILVQWASDYYRRWDKKENIQTTNVYFVLKRAKMCNDHHYH